MNKKHSTYFRKELEKIENAEVPAESHNLRLLLLDVLEEMDQREAASRKEPDTPAADQITDMVAYIETKGVSSEELDSLIHELHAELAAEVNNGGLHKQITYLIRSIGKDDTKQLLDDAVST